jgi:hypothetical protein
MELDAFKCRLGLGQGRVQPATLATTAGAWAFVLGDNQPGRRFELTPGDYAEVFQDTDLTGFALVRAQFTLRVPARMPAGLAWQASLTIDGVKHAVVEGRTGRTRSVTDLTANVSKLSGVHRVGVRLELVGA